MGYNSDQARDEKGRFAATNALITSGEEGDTDIREVFKGVKKLNPKHAAAIDKVEQKFNDAMAEGDGDMGQSDYSPDADGDAEIEIENTAYSNLRKAIAAPPNFKANQRFLPFGMADARNFIFTPPTILVMTFWPEDARWR